VIVQIILPQRKAKKEKTNNNNKMWGFKKTAKRIIITWNNIKGMAILPRWICLLQTFLM
jgi:hypothetical protein